MLLGGIIRLRSIPVHTGKPRSSRLAQALRKVYPRTHGETYSTCRFVGPCWGLSPYTRGNPAGGISPHSHQRSIPVHTGKPGQAGLHGIFFGVYPRTHGETTGTPDRPTMIQGLSPYTRGNQLQARPLAFGSGSIPVHTGKPHDFYCVCDESWVYPRTHGETPLCPPCTFAVWGLSPYTRGNRVKSLAV